MSTAPTSTSYGPTSAPPPNYLAWAIVATVLFFLPLGVVAIVYATQVKAKYQVGDYAGAQESSDNARRWALWSTVVGVLAWVAFVVAVASGLLTGTTTSTSY